MPLDPLPMTATLLPFQERQFRLITEMQSQTYRVIILFVPNGTMQKLALEVMQAWNVGPFPIVQGAGRLDQNITLVTLNGTGIHIPDLIFFS